MNFMDKSKVTVDTVRLPGMSTRPYVQYGIGLQKTFKENFMAFGQTMFQSGGRHGMSITAGLRWNIGNDHKKDEKVQNNNSEQVVNTIKYAPVPNAEQQIIQKEQKAIKEVKEVKLNTTKSPAQKITQPATTTVKPQTTQPKIKQQPNESVKKVHPTTHAPKQVQENVKNTKVKVQPTKNVEQKINTVKPSKQTVKKQPVTPQYEKTPTGKTIIKQLSNSTNTKTATQGVLKPLN